MSFALWPSTESIGTISSCKTSICCMSRAAPLKIPVPISSVAVLSSRATSCSRDDSAVRLSEPCQESTRCTFSPLMAVPLMLPLSFLPVCRVIDGQSKPKCCTMMDSCTSLIGHDITGHGTLQYCSASTVLTTASVPDACAECPNKLLCPSSGSPCTLWRVLSASSSPVISGTSDAGLPIACGCNTLS